MAVNLTFEKSLLSNKPSPPVPQPDPTAYPIKLVLDDGREAWVSCPQPDRVVLIGPLLPEHFNPAAKDPKELADYVLHFSKWLAISSGSSTSVKNTKLDPKTGLYKVVQLTGGSRSAGIDLEIIKPTKTSTWKLRIELNPRKLGSSGFEQLLQDLDYADKSFLVGRFLAEARLTRLDVAVDVVGVRVSEVLPYAPNSGKRVLYLGQDGVLESVYLHRRKPRPKPKWDGKGKAKKPSVTDPLGVALMTVYDRVRERARVLVAPPFGPAPVTRIEVRHRWKGHGPHVAALANLPSQLTDFRAGYTGNGKLGDRWLAYVECRRAAGPQRASAILKIGPKLAAGMEKAYLGERDCFLGVEGLWSHWPTAVKSTGLHKLVDEAEKSI